MKQEPCIYFDYVEDRRLRWRETLLIVVTGGLMSGAFFAAVAWSKAQAHGIEVPAAQEKEAADVARP